MKSNSFGELFNITTFGESHGEALGVVIDGLPSKLPFNQEALENFLGRRAPGKHISATKRTEPDKPIVLSGIFENKTLGTPVTIIIKNTNQKSSDYEKIKNNPRPGHADQTTLDKFDFKDHRGGGRASGRETVARVIAGYFAKLVLPKEIQIKSFISQIGEYHYPIKNSDNPFGYFHTPENKEDLLTNYLLNLREQGDSCGGEITLLIDHIPVGLGDPVFKKLKATLASAMLSIGSCISFELGSGKELIQKLGSEISNNRENFGGIEGGISNGQTLKIKMGFKAPSTIGDNAKEGRHDPCILPRALVVVESMALIVLADHYLKQKSLS